MKKQALSIIAVLVLCMALGACKKEREVDVNKLKNIFVEGISKELAEDGNKLEVDTIFLNQTTGDNYKGELRGHINDSTEVVYDLDVADDGSDLELEWNLRN